MGSGSWNSTVFCNYTASTKGVSLDSCGSVAYDTHTTHQDIYRERRLNSALDPRDVIRECVDSEEHPNTVPVLICLDVSGSMGSAAMEVSKQLNVIMTDLYKNHKDIEFLVMAIGDLAYDDAPIQVSQFESDIRIAEQLDKIYFEGGGGGNAFESYTAAWYFGVHCTKLDCWNRGKKGIIITMGDEEINPYLPVSTLKESLGSTCDAQGDVETKDLYNEVEKKFDVYHIHVNHGFSSERREKYNVASFASIIGEDHVAACNVKGIAQQIVAFIDISSKDNSDTGVQSDTDAISWENESSPDEDIKETIMNNDITW